VDQVVAPTLVDGKIRQEHLVLRVLQEWSAFHLVISNNRRSRASRRGKSCHSTSGSFALPYKAS
jgi:hypothetical protein